jgi:hypothetical protein
MKNRISKEDVLDSLANPLIKALGDEGITPSYLAKLLKKELNARIEKPFLGKDGIVYTKKMKALDIQQKARIDAQKLLDCYPDERHRITGEVTHNLSSNDLEWVKILKAELQGKTDR